MSDEKQLTPNHLIRKERLRRGWSQQEMADKVGTTPLNVSRWERGINLPSPYFRQKLSEVFEKSLQELGLVADNTPVDRSVEPLAADSLSSSPPAETPATFWNVPYNRNPLFTGREDILSQLHAALNAEERPVALTQPQAISGLGGIGKTQTTIEYAYRYREEYDAVLWVRADSRDLLISDFLLIASLLNLSQRNEQDQSVVVSAVLHWFDSHERWLLILDNADQLQVASEFIPSSDKGHVLLTTRAHSTGTVAQRIELEKMEVEEAILLLLRRAKQVRGSTIPIGLSKELIAQAKAIVEAVDGLPLAIDQAGAYIEETGCSLADYLKFYRTRRLRLLRTRGKDAVGHPEPVATTWSLSFEKVEQVKPAAAELLRLCAFLHPDEIPEAMITEGAAELGPVLQSVAEDEMELNEAIGELHRYSLIKRDPDLKLLNMHRLVQAVIRDTMDMEMERAWAERIVRMVSQAFPTVEFANWQKCQQYLPHAQVCVGFIEQWHMIFPEARNLLNQIGNYLYQRAQYKEAEPLLQKALMLHEQIAEPEHIDVTVDMIDLADLYTDMGKYTEAEMLYEKVRSIRERELGLLHPDVATAINNMGLLYREQGRFTQAEILFEQSLAIRKETLSPDHLGLATSYNNLALVLDDQGKYSNVAALHKQALTIWEQNLGPDHPYVATSLNNIGWHYYRQGQYDLVEEPHLRALAIREKGLGVNHPEVAMSLNALGLLYRDLGKYAKADFFLQRSLMIREQALGPNHIDVAQSLQNLGVLYFRQGKYGLAETLLQRSVQIREQLGSSNPLVAYSLHSLAVLYRHQGRYDEAEQLFQRTLLIREQALGKENIDLSYTLAALGVLRREQRRYEQAEALLLHALAIQERVLGLTHPHVAQSLHDLARLYSEEKKYEQVEPLFQRALTIREQILGMQHPDTASTLEAYSHLLRETGRESEAAALEQRAQAIRATKEE